MSIRKKWVILAAAVVLAALLARYGRHRHTGTPEYKARQSPPARRKNAATGPAGRPGDAATRPVAARPPTPRRPRDCKVVHVFVALCDNRHQGIVPVPASLGNGQDPRNNLYWGAMYGVKTFFARSRHWTAVRSSTKPATEAVLSRCLFRSKGAGPVVYVIADAYDGACMKAAMSDFLNAAAGSTVMEVRASGNGSARIQAGGYSDMVCFVGHNGLMDVRLAEFPENRGRPNPACAVVLACRSHSYFVGPLRKAKCRPLITTAGLMAPEAYTLDAIIRSWAAGDPPTATRQKAADAYAKYQKCSRRAALRLFVTGWGESRPAAAR